MSLSRKEAEKLFQLGFKRAAYADEVYPQDTFEYEDATWIIGGKILPSGTLLCDEKIYKEGKWIPSLADLISWLEDNDCIYSLTYTGLTYKTEASDNLGRNYKSKGATPEYALFNTIVKILKEYGGNPVNKSYEIIEAEFIKEEDT
ncbi:hypothetical protein P9597_29620 [Aneurinibacillus migulanus]|uniref:hypothetical protein n=1 Tax=Aneurinibacillus migulanus TaxID=47500 RepID=UPI002E1E5823|nr:hypothetical protein [Aneurinibacillus migulanus]